MKLNPTAWKEAAALEQRNSPAVSLHLTPGSPKPLHLFWPDTITFGTSTKSLYLQTGCFGLGCSYNSDFFFKLGLKPVIFSGSTAANTLKCPWSSFNFPAICPQGHACSKTVTINLDKGESWRLQKHLRRKKPMICPWEHRNSVPAVTGVYLCSQHWHMEAQPRVPPLAASAPPGKFTHLVLQAIPARQIPGCRGCNTAVLLNSELNLGTSLGFQFSFISEVDGLRTRTKPWSPSHGSCSMEVILLTNCGLGEHCLLLLFSPPGLSERESFTPVINILMTVS